MIRAIISQDTNDVWWLDIENMSYGSCVDTYIHLFDFIEQYAKTHKLGIKRVGIYCFELDKNHLPNQSCEYRW